MSTAYEQAVRDAYGTPEAWERERHGTFGAVIAERDRVPPHGTEYRYARFGCRCWPCRQARSLARLERKRRA